MIHGLKVGHKTPSGVGNTMENLMERELKGIRNKNQNRKHRQERSWK